MTGPPIDVTFQEGEPIQIKYFHTTAGLMEFEVTESEEGYVATLSDKWDELEWKHLKDGFEPWVTTEDVIDAVEELEFIEEVET